ncbi:OLC1v1031325C2 [Oldenlandia corymbosa var. corymbosa]|nr:OLC1v1031325C2 [Oldenlandia corymbosa var. corymbosa]
MESIRNFMTFNGTQLLNQLLKVSPDEFHRNRTLSIPLYDVNLFVKSNYKDWRSLVKYTLAKDARRAAWMASQIAVNSFTGEIHQDVVQIPVYDVEGAYATILEVGTPPQKDVWILDTGSNLIWWVCRPCKKCPAESFDPSKSSTFKRVNCDDLKDCPRWAGFQCGSSFGKKCVFQTRYLDGTKSQGFMARDKVYTIGGTLMESLKFGCSGAQPTTFQGHRYTGILGFGRGDLSFVSQYHAKSFSFCLTESFLGSPVYFDKLIIPKPTTLKVPLLLYLEKTYSTQLVGIFVGTQYVKANPYPPEDSTIRAVVDSGTKVTWLPTDIYYKFRDFFRTSFGLPYHRDEDVDLDTCYDLGGRDVTTLSVPTITFSFHGGKGEPKQYLSLQAAHILYPIDHRTYCLGFLPQVGNRDFVLFGSFQLTGTRVTVDLQYHNMYFDVNSC